MPPLMQQLRAFMQQFSGGQRIALIVIGVGVISSLVVLSLWANRPEFALLYADLAAEDANEMVSVLRDDSVPYQLQAGGSAVHIPADLVSEYRLRFAASGIATGSVTGYELFDEQRMGMTTFMQRVNYQRALEGELARTLMQMAEVRMARVHLVIPEKKFFEEGQEASAAIVLHLKSSAALRQIQIRGIARMVANAVPDLREEDVSIVDATGRLLTDSIQERGPAPTGSINWEIRQSVERELQAKIQDMVDDVLGAGKSIVKVSATLNFEQLERTSEIFDTENSAVLSEERSTERFQGSDTSSRSVEQTVTNYELNKTTEHFIASSGDVQRLTVALLVDGTYSLVTDENGDEQLEYQPRSQEVLDRLEALIITAVGIDPDRGDLVEVQNIQFDREEELASLASIRAIERQEFISNIATNVAIIGALLITAFLLLRMLKRTSSDISHVFLPPPPLGKTLVGAGEGAVDAIPGAGATVEARGQLEMATDEFLQKLSPEARAQLEAMEKMTSEVTAFTEENPEGAAALLRIWTSAAEKEQ